MGQDAERIAFIDIWWTKEGKLRSQVSSSCRNCCRNSCRNRCNSGDSRIRCNRIAALPEARGTWHSRGCAPRCTTAVRGVHAVTHVVTYRYVPLRAVTCRSQVQYLPCEEFEAEEKCAAYVKKQARGPCGYIGYVGYGSPEAASVKAYVKKHATILDHAVTME